MRSIDAGNLSAEPLAIQQLTAAQKDRLTEILDRYLAALEGGVPAAQEDLLAAHPDLAEPLRTYFRSLDELHAAADGFAGPVPQPAPEPEPRGTERRLGDFRIVREIGRGGMGVVYEARQISLGRRVALKILPFAAVLDSRQIARFKHEAQAAAQLDHPHIVSVYAVGVERGVHYFAMQFIDGQPLDRALRELQQALGIEPAATPETAPAPPADLGNARTVDYCRSTARPFLTGPTTDRREYFRTVTQLGIQAAEALHAAHENGVVHRDVKPSNLLLDGDGKLWITDFGLARCRSDVSLTRTGEVVGTLRYMSPEQALGQSALVDQRTDVYALGVTLYELLTLHSAFPGDDGPALLRRIEQHEPRRPRDLQPKLPVDLETVVLKAMAKRRDDRYATARELADDLQRVLDGRPTCARPPTLLDRAARWSRRHHRVVVAVAGAASLALLGMTTSMLLIAQEKSRAEANYSRAERHFREAREAVDRLGARLAERLAAVPGAQQVRRELLRETLAYYQGFVSQAQANPTLRADLAMTYSKIGTLAAEIGSAEEAAAAHRNAVTLLRQLAADSPHASDYQGRLAVAYNNLALVHSRAGRIDDARRAYGEAIRLQEQLLAGPGNVEPYLSDLALSHAGCGLLQSEIGARPEAETSFRQALRLSQQLLALQPENPEYRHGLAAALNNLSTLYVATEPARAAELYQQALAQQTLAAAAQPAALKYRSDMALTHNNLGAVQSRMGQFAEAAGSYRRAIEIQTELVQAAAAQKSYRHDLAVTYNNLGLTQCKLQQEAAAQHSFRQALALQEALVQQDPQDLNLQSSLGGIYNNLGMIEEQQQHAAAAAESYRAAVEHQREAYSHAPQVSQYRVFLSKHYYNYGRALREVGRPTEAVRAALERRALWPHDPEHLFAVAEELASAIGLLKSATPTAVSATRCAEYALETLRQAQSAGWKPSANGEWMAPFAALKDYPEFAGLLKM